MEKSKLAKLKYTLEDVKEINPVSFTRADCINSIWARGLKKKKKKKKTFFLSIFDPEKCSSLVIRVKTDYQREGIVPKNFFFFARL